MVYRTTTVTENLKMSNSKVAMLIINQCSFYRYSLNGSPLYITSPSNPASTQAMCIPCCEYCGASRIFELQLMPGLVNFLKIQGQDGEYILKICHFTTKLQNKNN